VLFDHVAIPFSSIAGGRFALAARTGALTENIWIDNFQLTTMPRPSDSAIGAYTFTTMAGRPAIGSADGVGGNAQFNRPGSVAADAAGNVFVADTGNHTIRKITPAGEVSTIAGFPGVAGASDGTNRNARFYGPEGLTLDNTGNLYVADAPRIRKVSPAGTNWVVTTIAGAGYRGATDGIGTNSLFDYPTAIAVDGARNLFLADAGASTIRRIVPPNWVVSRIAGVPYIYGNQDGVGSAALFDFMSGIAVDNSGGVYVVDKENQAIRKITLVDTNVSTLAGFPNFNLPIAIAAATSSEVYVSDDRGTIKKLTGAGTNWVVTNFAGLFAGYADGTGTNARFGGRLGIGGPLGVALDSAGNVYVGDTENHAIRGITSAGVVRTIAGAVGSRG